MVIANLVQRPRRQPPPPPARQQQPPSPHRDPPQLGPKIPLIEPPPSHTEGGSSRGLERPKRKRHEVGGDDTRLSASNLDIFADLIPAYCSEEQLGELSRVSPRAADELVARNLIQATFLQLTRSRNLQNQLETAAAKDKEIAELGERIKEADKKHANEVQLLRENLQAQEHNSEKKVRALEDRLSEEKRAHADQIATLSGLLEAAKKDKEEEEGRWLAKVEAEKKVSYEAGSEDYVYSMALHFRDLDFSHFGEDAVRIAAEARAEHPLQPEEHAPPPPESPPAGGGVPQSPPNNAPPQSPPNDPPPQSPPAAE